MEFFFLVYQYVVLVGSPSPGAIFQILNERPSIQGELHCEEERLKTQKHPLEGKKTDDEDSSFLGKRAYLPDKLGRVTPKAIVPMCTGDSGVVATIGWSDLWISIKVRVPVAISPILMRFGAAVLGFQFKVVCAFSSYVNRSGLLRYS